MTSTELHSPAQAASENRGTASREAGFDVLRAALTLLVVFHHAAITYGALGGWYLREVEPDWSFSSTVLILFCTLNQAYFMGLFFMIAGYFTRGSLARRGPKAYAGERLLRLGVPLLVYGVLIGPMTVALARTARGQAFTDTLLALWTGLRFENGPLWFAQALLIFAAGFLAIATIEPSVTRIIRRPPPTNLSFAAGILATGAAAFLLRLVWPVGTQVWGLQLGYFASYVVLFAVGCSAASGLWLDQIPSRQIRLWQTVAGVTFPTLPLVVLLAPRVTAFQGNTMGGWNIQAALYAFWEPLVAWGVILTLYGLSRRHFDHPGLIWRRLARRAYTIFIIHPPILVGITLAWRSVEAPSLVKFCLTGSATCLVCYWLADILLSSRLLRRIV